MEIIEGVTAASSGDVYYYGEIAGRRFRQEAGIQFQNTALQDFITVRETIEMFRSLYDRQADFDEIVEQCSLGDLLDRDNRKLSGGQRQRLLLAVALVNRPRLIFLGRADNGARSPGAPQFLGPGTEYSRRRRHDIADHALHGRGAGIVR